MQYALTKAIEFVAAFYHMAPGSHKEPYQNDLLGSCDSLLAWMRITTSIDYFAIQTVLIIYSSYSFHFIFIYCNPGEAMIKTVLLGNTEHKTVIT